MPCPHVRTAPKGAEQLPASPRNALIARLDRRTVVSIRRTALPIEAAKHPCQPIRRRRLSDDARRRVEEFDRFDH